jgi:membrane protease YdiL (CAAX protease family)
VRLSSSGQRRLPPTPRAPRLDLAGRVVAFYGLVAAAAVVWGALRRHSNLLWLDPRSGSAASPLGLGGGVSHLVSSAALGVAMGFLLVLLTRALQARYEWARVLHNEFRHLLGPLSRREILLLAAASAIGEECLFRGALLPHLAALSAGPLGLALGVLGSAAVFALLHIGPGVRFLPWTLSALLMGVLLGGLFVAAGDLLGPIAVHFTVNLLNLRHIVRRPATAP